MCRKKDDKKASSRAPSPTRGGASLSASLAILTPHMAAKAKTMLGSECEIDVGDGPQNAENRLRRLLGAAITRFEQMRTDMQEIKRYKEQHESLLGALEKLVQVWKVSSYPADFAIQHPIERTLSFLSDCFYVCVQTHKGWTREGVQVEQSHEQDSTSHPPIPNLLEPDSGSCSPGSIRSLLGRIDQTLQNVDKVLDVDSHESHDCAPTDKALPASPFVLPSKSMTLEDIKRHVREMADRAAQATTSHHAKYTSPPLNDSKEVVPDLSPCSCLDWDAFINKNNDCTTQHLIDRKPNSSTTSTKSVIHKVQVVQQHLNENCKATSDDRVTPVQALDTQKSEMIRLAKEDAMRKAREDCERLNRTSPVSELDLLGHLQSQGEIMAAPSKPVLIDVLPPSSLVDSREKLVCPSKRASVESQQQNFAHEHYTGGVNISNNVIKRVPQYSGHEQQPQQQRPLQEKKPIYTSAAPVQSSVGQPVVINLGNTKKSQANNQVTPSPMRHVPLQVLPRRQIPHQSSQPQHQPQHHQHQHQLQQGHQHLQQKEQQQQQQAATSNSILANYTQVNFADAQHATMQQYDARRKSMPVVFSLPMRMNSQGSISAQIMKPPTTATTQMNHGAYSHECAPRDYNKENSMNLFVSHESFRSR